PIKFLVGIKSYLPLSPRIKGMSSGGFGERLRGERKIPLVKYRKSVGLPALRFIELRCWFFSARKFFKILKHKKARL
uniref:hypothetical protein n=1 Tax=Maribellus mangrovi TaxID=3133146 RepID=UPI0030EE9234